MDKYNINEKAQFIRLTILLHDLVCYDKDLQEQISDKESLIRKFRNTRNVFISLHNLRDALNDVQVSKDQEFISRTRALRRKLDFIGHVRNKGVGHIDKELLKRAAQWSPEIFYENTKDNADYLIFECYRALLQTSINSHLNNIGEHKVFTSTIDLLYPPNAAEFFHYLSEIVNDSIKWLSEASETTKSRIHFHSRDQILELAEIAAQTNFDLNSDSNMNFNKEEAGAKLLITIDRLRSAGVEESAIDIVKRIYEEI